VLALALSLSLLLAGLSYLYYLQVIFPTLVPYHGGGEPFTLDEWNNYTFRIPWYAQTRLHLTVQTDQVVELYVNDSPLCNRTECELVIEPGRKAIITPRSNSFAAGRFTARQETSGAQLLVASGLSMAGLLATVLSAKQWLTTARRVYGWVPAKL